VIQFLIMNLFHSRQSVTAGYDFPTTRKAGWVAGSLGERPITGVELVEPRALEPGELGVHHPAYVAAVMSGEPRELAESQGFDWDPQLPASVLAMNGGMVAAALDALDSGVSGCLGSGFHHAKRERGDGFCTFNGIALAAKRALEAGASSVLVLDLDAHCAGGTYELIADILTGDERISQTDVAVSPFDWYLPVERCTLDVVSSAEEYLPTVRRRLDELSAQAEKPALCIYYAGMDPDERCDIGGLRGITAEVLAERERLVFDWCASERVPVAFGLAGGYTSERLSREELVELHRGTIAEAARIVGPAGL
jgi:acetoin utilization deacetylase AcuC-like enzyme